MLVLYELSEIILLLWIPDESEEFIRDSNFTALQGCVESDDGNSLDEAIRKAMDNDIPIELGLYFNQNYKKIRYYF